MRAGSGSASTVRGHDVLGQLDVRRPGLLGLRDLERLADDLGDDPRVGQPGVPLRDRLEHRDDVDVLVGLLVHALEVALAGERDERRAVQERVGHRGDEVRRARARACRGRRRRAGSAGRTCRPCTRRPARGAPGRTSTLESLERLVEVQRLLARDAEDVLDPLGLQALHEQIGRLALAHPATSIPATCRANVRDRPRRRFVPMTRIRCTPPPRAARARLPRPPRAAPHAAIAADDPRRGLRPRRRHEPVRRATGSPSRARATARSSAHYYTGTALGAAAPGHTVRVLLQQRAVGARSRGAARAGARRLDPARTYGVARRGRSQVDLRTSRRAPRRHASRAAAARSAGADGAVRAERRTGGAYRGALEFRPAGFGARRDQRRRPRRLRARRRARESPAVVAARGAQGAGRRGAHLRDHDHQGRRRLRPLRRHALAGLRRRRRPRRPRPTRPWPRPRARSSPTAASRSSPTSSPPPAGARRTSRTRSAASRCRG